MGKKRNGFVCLYISALWRCLLPRRHVSSPPLMEMFHSIRASQCLGQHDGLGPLWIYFSHKSRVADENHPISALPSLALSLVLMEWPEWRKAGGEGGDGGLRDLHRCRREAPAPSLRVFYSLRDLQRSVLPRFAQRSCCCPVPEVFWTRLDGACRMSPCYKMSFKAPSNLSRSGIV